MIPLYPEAFERPNVHPHYVPLPYRDDGVAHALRAIFPVESDRLTPEMSALVARLDAQEISGPR